MRRRKLSKAQRLNVYNLFGGRCAYCGKPIAYEDMQVDHVVPLHNGGADNESNYFPAFRMCNYYKSTFTLEKFREQLGLLKGRLEKDFTYRLALRDRRSLRAPLFFLFACGIIKITELPDKHLMVRE